MVDRAARLLFIGDQRIAPVKKQHPKMLGIAVRHRGVAIIEQSVPGRDHIAADHPGAGKALGGGLDDLELLHHRFADARNLAQPLGRCRHHAVEIAEPVEQRVRQRLHVLPRDRPEQHQLKQFVIRHRAGTAGHEPGAQSLAMIGDVGRLAAIGNRDRQGRGLAREKGQGPFGHMRLMVRHAPRVTRRDERKVNGSGLTGWSGSPRGCPNPSSRPRNS